MKYLKIPVRKIDPSLINKKLPTLEELCKDVEEIEVEEVKKDCDETPNAE